MTQAENPTQAAIAVFQNVVKRKKKVALSNFIIISKKGFASDVKELWRLGIDRKMGDDVIFSTTAFLKKAGIKEIEIDPND